VDIPQSLLEEIRDMTQTSSGATYVDVFSLLEDRIGIEVDDEQAIEVWKMHFVQSIVSAISNKSDDSTVFSVYVAQDEPPRYLSWKVLSVEVLSRILDGLQRTKDKLLKKIEALDQKIARIRGFIATKPLDFGDKDEISEPRVTKRKVRQSKKSA
jgi:hypothetical protein